MKRYGSRARYLRWVVAACCLLGLSLAQTVMAQEGEPLTIKELLARHQATVDKIKTFRYDVEWVSDNSGGESVYSMVGTIFSDHQRYLGDAHIYQQHATGELEDWRRLVVIHGDVYLILNYKLDETPPESVRLSQIDMSIVSESGKKSARVLAFGALGLADRFAFGRANLTSGTPLVSLSEALPEWLDCQDGEVAKPFGGIGEWTVSLLLESGIYRATVWGIGAKVYEFDFDSLNGFLLSGHRYYDPSDGDIIFEYQVEYGRFSATPFPVRIHGNRYSPNSITSFSFELSNIDVNLDLTDNLFTADEIVRRSSEVPHIRHMREQTREESFYSFGKPVSRGEAQKVLQALVPEEVRNRAVGGPSVEARLTESRRWHRAAYLFVPVGLILIFGGVLLALYFRR